MDNNELKKMVFLVPVVDRRMIAENTYEVTFDLSGHNFQFRAGQYVWISLLKLNFPDPRGDVRAFSIVSSPAAPKRISVVFRSSESGFKKTLVALPIGEKVRVSGPFGFLDLPAESGRPVVFIAGGVGVAPFLSMLSDAAAHKSDRRMVMLYANTSEDRMLYREELMRFSRDNPHFTVFFVTQHISRELINKATKDLHHPLWYLMGPRNMVVETGKILGGMGIPDEDFSYEESSPFLYRSARVIAQDHISKTGLLWTGLESLAVQVIITNPEGEIFYANPATEKATGYSLSEIVGQTPRLWGGLMDHNFYKDLWTTIKYNRGAFSGRVTNRRKDGNKYVANLHVSPFFLKDGELGGFMAIEENITELFQEKEGAMNLAAIIQSSTDAIARVDLDGIVMSWNPAAERMFHYTEKEIIGQPIFEKIGGAKKEEMQTNIEAVKTGKTMNDMRSTRQTKDGAVINVLVSNWPVYDANNTLVGSSVLYHDISREEVLRELESQFIIIAAHQLRTPLTGIQWVSERLLKTAKLDFHGRSYLKDINSETLRLINLVNTLLNAARIEGGVLSVTPIPTEAVSFVAGQLKGYKRLMSSKKQTLAFITRGKRIDMETDQNAFRDIVQSLVTNAIEYTPDKGKITVHLKKLGNNLVLTVSDTGIGIPVTAQDFIFAKFFRADNAKLFKADGTGLGLYIAREAAKMLGGTIVFTSRLGRGTVFTVTLPLMTKTVKAEKSLI